MDVDALGAIFLGDVRPSTLARCGRIEATSDAAVVLGRRDVRRRPCSLRGDVVLIGPIQDQPEPAPLTMPNGPEGQR